ncbi:hypothetical protein F5Y13DRAFT_198455 [Hypoxylon sp. FL1857]|nr:hypothetical protein F5Y13DRAFT_198455 [Hypoxylon sp. FL1857]
MFNSTRNVPFDLDDPRFSIWTLGVSWTLTPIAIMAVCARFYLRKALAYGWESHDWLMLVASILQIFYQVGLTIMCRWGSGKALQDLTTLELMMVMKWSWVIAPAVHLIAIIARLSIAILLIHLFGAKRWFKGYLIIFTTIQSLVGLVVVIVALAQCQPYELCWNPSAHGVRWNPKIYEWAAVVPICKSWPFCSYVLD